MRRGLVGVLTAAITFALPIVPDATTGRQPCCKRQVFLVLMENLSYEDALNPGWPMTRVGGVGMGLMAAADDREISGERVYEAIGAGGARSGAMGEALQRAGLRTGVIPSTRLRPEAIEALVGGAEVVEVDESIASRSLIIGSGPAGVIETYSALTFTHSEEFLFIATTTMRSPAMRRSSDEAPPIVIARGNTDLFNPREGTVCLFRVLAPFAGCGRGLTSHTTRRDGIVSNVDVAPTILEFLGVPIPDEMTGSPIRIEGAPPTRLHERYLQYQRVHTPVGLLALAVVLGTLFASVGVLISRRRFSAKVLETLGSLALVSVALPVVMFPASLLPRLSYRVVLPTIIAGAALVTIAALWWGRWSLAAPVAIVAGLGMGVVILDGVLGWPAMLMPLLGDSALEGVRFYGMGNAFAGVYMSGAVLLSARLPPVAGMGLLLATGLLAGLPGFGAELGTSVTLFLAAGLWYMLRVRKRFGFREVATAGAITVAGLATILLIHRFSDIPTHVTRVVEEAERSGAGELLAVFGERLALNVRNTSAIPVAWLIVALLPVWLVVAWNRLGPFGPTLRKDPAWRDAAVVLAVAAIVGFLVNDSIGVTGLAFTFLSAALIYPALRERWTISA